MTEADVQETGVADVLAREADLGMRRWPMARRVDEVRRQGPAA